MGGSAWRIMLDGLQYVFKMNSLGYEFLAEQGMSKFSLCNLPDVQNDKIGCYKYLNSLSLTPD